MDVTNNGDHLLFPIASKSLDSGTRECDAKPQRVANRFRKYSAASWHSYKDIHRIQ